MNDRPFDRLVVGGGIVGLAVARETLLRRPGLRLALIEKEAGPARHQTGHNSGVIHSGVYYKPGSLKAKLCLEGRRLLLEFCDEKSIPYWIGGKVIVALTERDVAPLESIFERGVANGVGGLERLGPEGIREREPHVRGLRALWVPSAGIVDYSAVAGALAAEIGRLGGEIRTGVTVATVRSASPGVVLETNGGPIAGSDAILCAGLQSDRLWRSPRKRSDVRIVPFRGDYYILRPERRDLIRSLVYPVPDPRFPFLGVHFTKRLDGEVLAGPNAVLALAREGYGRFRFSARDSASVVTWPGFWRLSRRHWRTGAAEIWRDYVKSAFLRDLRSFVPEVRSSDLLPGPCGIRAQAVGRNGDLIDDFAVSREGPITHVLNAPSPAATSSFAIAREVVNGVESRAAGSRLGRG